MKGLLHEIAFGVLAFRPDAVDAYVPQVKALLTSEAVANTRTVHKATEQEMMMDVGLCFYTQEGHRMMAGVDEVTPDSGMVAVMNINGAIMKNDFCGSPGATRMSQWLANFETTQEVTGVVLNVDSPGGNGHAMNVLAGQISRMSKPVVSLVSHGMACSAAYGISSACDLVMTSSAQDEIGSIGTYVRLHDWSGVNEKEGLKVHEIYATRSTAKNGVVREAFKADPKNQDDEHYKAIREQYIDPFNEAFIAMVQQNRPGVKDENDVLRGRVFMSADAMKYGLIDSTGETLESAIAAVRNLATKNNN